MNKNLLFFTLLSFSAATAQQQQQPYQMTPKEAERHAKDIDKSRKNGDIIWDFDTVYIAGVPNCIVYKIDKGALQHDDYSIRSLTNQELIYVRYCTAPDYTVAHAPNTPPPTIGYYSYVFYDTKNTGETYSDIRPFKTIGRYHLVANGASIDPNGESNFIAENPPKWSVAQPPPAPTVVVVNNPPPPPVVNTYTPPQSQAINGATNPQPANNYYQPTSQTINGAANPQPVNNYNQPTSQTINGATNPQPANNYYQPTSQTINGATNPPQMQSINNNTGNNYVLVPRDMNGDIRVDQNNIYQGGQVIGMIQYNEVNVNGMFTKTMSISLPNGTKVAQGYTPPNGDVHAWNVVTMKDRASNVVTAHEGHDKEDVLWFLVKGLYL